MVNLLKEAREGSVKLIRLRMARNLRAQKTLQYDVKNFDLCVTRKLKTGR